MTPLIVYFRSWFTLPLKPFSHQWLILMCLWKRRSKILLYLKLNCALISQGHDLESDWSPHLTPYYLCCTDCDKIVISGRTYQLTRLDNTTASVRVPHSTDDVRSLSSLLDSMCKHVHSHCVSASSVRRYLFLRSRRLPAAGPGTQRRSAEDKRNGRRSRSASYRYNAVTWCHKI